jgi:hypothetical protein
MNRQRMKWLTLTILALALVAALAVPAGAQTPRELFRWAIIEKLTVQQGGAQFQSDVQIEGNELYLDADDDTYLSTATDDTIDVYISDAKDFTLTANTLTAQSGSTIAAQALTAISAMVDGAADAVLLTVQGNATQTSSLIVAEQSDGTDKLTVANTGQVVFSPEADSDGANYDEWVTIAGEMTGVGTKDRNYGLLIEMTRPAGQEITNGDHDEAGLKIRVDTEAVTTTTGTVLRGADIEAKADNPDGTVTNLYGAAVTAKSDTSAGSVANMIALTTNAQANAEVTDSMMAADMRLFRQSANEPTAEYVVQVRNSSTTGTGADAGIYVTSDYSDTLATDNMDYGLDMDTADVTTADIRLSNGETISNVTDTVVQVGGFFALSVGATQDLGAGFTLTATASYQPITNSTGGSITSDTTTAIANGVVAGQVLILCNLDAQDIVIDDGANTDLGGNVTLTGGAKDTLTLIWDGTDWMGLAVHDN